MFKVVIVDDEPLIVRSVKNQIETLDKDFQVVGSANDGITALTVIEQASPDLVFIDIAMPVMDGFELLECLRKKGITVPAVILSGYREFSYARKAIQLGVLDYLVKPLNPVMLEDFLKNLKLKLIRTQKQAKKEELLAYLRGSAHPVGKQPLYSGVDRFYLTKICFGSYHFFRNNQFSVQEVQDAVVQLEQAAEKCIGDYSEWVILNEKEENEFLLVIQTEEQYGKRKAFAVYEELNILIKAEEYVTFVATEKSVPAASLAAEKKLLETYLYHRGLFAKSSYVLCAEGIEERSFSETDCRAIKKLVEGKKEKEVRKQIHQLINQLMENSGTQAEISHTLRGILLVCCQNTAEYELYFMLNLVLCSSRNYSELEEKFMELLLEYSGMTQADTYLNAGTEQMVARIQTYLDQHYQEKIKIQEVAELYGFNYSYLCHLFKKHVNLSPNEYIIMKRMEYAKRLLSDQKELSIRELAEMSGYQDPYYFSRMFKSYEGISPSDYKKQFFSEE